MIRLLLLFLLYKSCCSAELAACDEDSHCPSDFYCESDAFACRQCLRCEEFGRSPSSSATNCVRSVVECGPCLEGLDYAQDSVKEKCVLRGTTQELLPIYAWVITAVCIIAVLYLVVHFLCKTRILNKIVYSITCTATQQPQGPARNDSQLTASAPEYRAVAMEINPGYRQRQNESVLETDRPPFYNTLYPLLENEPLMHDHVETPEEPINIKPVIRTKRRSHDRESMDHHSAVVFNKAIYEDESHPLNNPTPTPDTGSSLDMGVTQLDGNVQNDTHVDVESGAPIAQNTSALMAPDVPLNSSSGALMNVAYPTIVSNPSTPTTSTTDTPSNAQDPCNNNTVVNQVTCTFSTAAMDEGNASTILVQNMNIVQVKKISCRKSRSTF